MKLAIICLGVLFMLLGAYWLIDPAFFYGFIVDNLKNSSFYFVAIAVRLVLGVLFIKAAAESKYPKLIRGLGYLAIIAAIVFIIIGENGFQNMISSFIPSLESYGRTGGILCVVFGAFFVHAFSETKE